MLLLPFSALWTLFLGDLKLIYVLVYLDDINLFSKAFTDHLQLLEEVFKRLLANNLKIKPIKCSFFKLQLDYLVFVNDPHGLRPQPAKVDGINKMAAPSNKKDIQVFLGVVSYYSHFILNFSKHTEPIFWLFKKEAEFAWTEQCEIAFKYLKKCLVTNPILAYPDFEKEFIVQTDANQTAVGAVLSQIGADNLEHPVSFCSRTLNNHERN